MSIFVIGIIASNARFAAAASELSRASSRTRGVICQEKLQRSLHHPLALSPPLLSIIDNGGAQSACGWCKDRCGFSWQITPRVLLDALDSSDAAAAKRAFDAMMPMTKIDIATIEAALRGETVDA